ncbi:MAG: threonine synthase [Actinomycetia bacterium]|nr:threonine synthase [Actinomycetes bacterium]
MLFRFTDTRGLVRTPVSFTEAILAGLAPGGGLFVPAELPHFSAGELTALTALPYHARAAWLYRAFGVDLDDATLTALCADAYDKQWDDPRIAPIRPLADDTFVLELWHGPTSAFKDLALQLTARTFSAAIAKQRADGRLSHDVLILVATSGDTGTAALNGFADRAHTNIIVFYPADGVSEIQRHQMASQSGDNLAVFGVKGNFDDCQNAVKAAFGDAALAEQLAARADLQFSSANSINWGRLMPQIVYYLSSAAELAAAGTISSERPLDIAVPTGNFGNILAAWYAKRMGAPIGRLICASNSNKVLADFLESGVYDIRGRVFTTTPTPSMDILISSNLERLLYELAGAQACAGWMENLRREQRFAVDADTLALIQGEFVGAWLDNDQTLAAVRSLYEEQHYLCDPHSALAVEVGRQLKSDRPLLVAATAHWAKFAPDVVRALTGTAYSAELPAEYAHRGELDLMRVVRELAPHSGIIPPHLADLAERPERFTEVIAVGADAACDAILTWATQHK